MESSPLFSAKATKSLGPQKFLAVHLVTSPVTGKSAYFARPKYLYDERPDFSEQPSSKKLARSPGPSSAAVTPASQRYASPRRHIRLQRKEERTMLKLAKAELANELYEQEVAANTKLKKKINPNKWVHLLALHNLIIQKKYKFCRALYDAFDNSAPTTHITTPQFTSTIIGNYKFPHASIDIQLLLRSLYNSFSLDGLTLDWREFVCSFRVLEKPVENARTRLLWWFSVYDGDNIGLLSFRDCSNLVSSAVRNDAEQKVCKCISSILCHEHTHFIS